MTTVEAEKVIRNVIENKSKKVKMNKQIGETENSERQYKAFQRSYNIGYKQVVELKGRRKRRTR